MKGDIFVSFSEKLYYYFGMRRSLVLSILFALVLAVPVAKAQTNYKLHSLFIFSFTRYVQWPDAYNQGEFEIVVLGDTPLLEELKTMSQTKKVGDRGIKVTRINGVSDIRKCNILFVPSTKSGQLADVMARVKDQSILVITEESGMGSKGSNINFIQKDGKLAFELNQGSLAKQNLKVSNELSRLAILI